MFFYMEENEDKIARKIVYQIRRGSILENISQVLLFLYIYKEKKRKVEIKIYFAFEFVFACNMCLCV